MSVHHTAVAVYQTQKKTGKERIYARGKIRALVSDSGAKNPGLCLTHFVHAAETWRERERERCLVYIRS